MQANPTVAEATCDSCGDAERLEKCESWTYCATCAADWRGYVFGCQTMALYALGQAVVAAKEEDLTSAQIVQYVQCALDGNDNRDEVHKVVAGIAPPLRRLD